ncbi:MAG: hypothetical protein H5T84_01515 [Thermoleophilia bacterium]|nr:hypothetical protein [Thermoleophilia bacterium]
MQVASSHRSVHHYPEYTTETEDIAEYLSLRQALERRGIRHILGSSGMLVRVGDCVLRLYGPAQPLRVQEGDDPWCGRVLPPTSDELNAGSLISVVEVGGIRALLPGDAEADVLQQDNLPPVDVLVVPHHGSKGAVSRQLLAQIKPLTACISVGRDNSFGHPHQETMTLLTAAHVKAARTDLQGWVSYTKKDGVLLVASEKATGDRGK